MQSGTRTANLSTHQRQRDQATRIIGAVNMLGYAHTPENHAGLGGGKIAGNLTQGISLNTAEFRHVFWTKRFQMRFHIFPVFGETIDILRVIQIFFDNHMHNRVQHGHIRPRTELQHMGRVPFHPLTAWVHDDQLTAPLGKLFEIGRRHRVIFNGVTTDQNSHIGIFNFIKSRRNRA